MKCPFFFFLRLFVLVSILLLPSTFVKAQNISLSQIENIVDSSVGYATTLLSNNKWIYHGTIAPEDAPSYKIYQFLNTQNNVVSRIALFVSIDSRKIDMFLLDTPIQNQYREILNELNGNKGYRADTTIIKEREIKKKYVSTYFDNHKNENKLFDLGLKVLNLSERLQKDTYKNTYSIQMEVQYRIH
jgi:hypothetical protein